jgi:hypothetical protein
VAVPFKTPPTKPVTLSGVFTRVNYVHIPPFLATKRGGYTPTLGEHNPLKKAKKQGHPRSFAWLFVLSYKRSIGYYLDG